MLQRRVSWCSVCGEISKRREEREREEREILAHALFFSFSFFHPSPSFITLPIGIKRKRGQYVGDGEKRLMMAYLCEGKRKRKRGRNLHVENPRDRRTVKKGNTYKSCSNLHLLPPRKLIVPQLTVGSRYHILWRVYPTA